jgi:hypothetical protein
LLNTKRFFAELYSTYGEKEEVNHCDALFVEYDDTSVVAVIVVFAAPLAGLIMLICGSFVTGRGGVGHVQSAPGLLRAGRDNFKVNPRMRSPFVGILHMLF